MYVLQPELQDAKKIGICLPQARRDMYLGVSPVHSSSVALALNLTTGFISPQFNVVHDDLFATVTSHWDDGTFDPDHWNTIIQSGQEHYCDPSTHPTPLTDDWISPSEQAVQEQRRQFHRRRHASARQRGYLRLRDHLPGGGYLNQTVYLTICLSIHRKLLPKLLYKFQVKCHLPLQHPCLILIIILIYLKRKIKIKIKKLESLYMKTSQERELDAKFVLRNV
jgi:hypothetical protein